MSLGSSNQSLWDGYNNHVYKLHLILERASLTVGIPVNNEKRLTLKDDLEKELAILDAELQKLVPIEVRDLHPRRKDKVTGNVEYGFKRQPKEIAPLISSYQLAIEKVLEKNPDAKVLSPAEFIYKKLGLVTWYDELLDKYNWCKVKPFKPSSQQIIRYLEFVIEKLEISGTKEDKKLAKLYKIPVNFKTKKKTSGKKELEELLEKTGDEVLKNVQEYRSIKYNLSNSIPNWKPDDNGFVHTTWGFTAPTGQLDSRSPNILNCSKHTKIGKIFRKIVESPKGYCFVEFDFKSFHVGLMGFRANDKTYIRFSQLDPHSIYCSHIIRDDNNVTPLIPHLVDWSDDEIMKVCKYIKTNYKSVRQEQAKPTVLGNQLGLGPFKLQHQNRKYIPTVARAKELQSIIKTEFPKVERAKAEIIERAFVQGYLINEFGRIQYFYDVFNFSFDKKTGKWEKKHGTDTEKVLAFAVQSPAFGMIHSKLLELEEEGIEKNGESWLDRFNFNNSIHDQVAFMPRIEDRDLCLEIVGRKLQEPCRWLVNDATGPGGLQIGVDASWGLNWQDKGEGNEYGMEDVKI